MVKKAQEQPKKEWYLYSAASIFIASICIITILFPGDSQVQTFGYTISSVLLFIFGTSEKWKNQEASNHILFIIFSLIVVLIPLFIHSLEELFKKIFVSNNNAYEKFS